MDSVVIPLYTERMKNEKQAANHTVTRRWRGWAILLGVLLLLAAGVWWYYHVPEFVLVERTPLPRLVTGFYEGAIWVIGQPDIANAMRQFPKPCLLFGAYGKLQSLSISAAQDIDFSPLEWESSPNQRYLAMRNGSTLHLWLDGKYCCSTKLQFAYDEMKVLDSGRMICFSWESRRLYIIEGKRIIAWGLMPRISTTSFEEYPSFSPDGNSLLIRADQKGISACYRVAIIGKRIIFTQSFVTCETPLPIIAILVGHLSSEYALQSVAACYL